MKEKGLVSVGIPTYNRPEGLRRTLECITAQTYKNLEIIISDNASPGIDTEVIVREFMAIDKRIKYYKQQDNKGLTYNFNFVLEKATGDFFMWAADDDEWDNSYIYECLQTLLCNPDYTLVCGTAIYYKDGEILYPGVKVNLLHDSPAKRVLGYYSRVGDNGTFYGVMRREAVTKLSMKNTIGGDWHFIAIVAFLGKIKTLDNVIIKRKLGDSTGGLKKLATLLGVSKFQACNPYLSIAIEAFSDIAWKEKKFAGINSFKRLYLAVIVFIGLLNRLIVCPTLGQFTLKALRLQCKERRK